MVERRVSTDDALAYLAAGVDVTVVGRPGSGRTTFLHGLGNELENAGYRVVRVVGVAALSASPLGVLYALVSGENGLQPGLPALKVAVDWFVAKAESGNLRVLIDDADCLDEMSWGAILSAQATHPFGIVSCELHSRGEAPLSHRRRSYEVDLPPLNREEIEQILSNRGGAPVDPGTVSRIFGKSFGLPGLAVGLWDIGCQEKTITLEGGAFVARDDLWSPALGRLIDRQLAGTKRRERDALEMLSHAGSLDLDATIDRVGSKILDRLEEKGLVRFELSSGRLLSVVTPPLVAEHFRHTPLRAHHSRQLSSIAMPWIDDPADAAVHAAPAPNALFVRAVHERSRSRMLVARTAWVQQQSATTAVEYLDARDRTTSGARLTPAVVGATASESSGDELSQAQLGIWQAGWTARNIGVDAALAELATLESRLPAFAALVDAARLRLRIEGVGSAPEELAPGVDADLDAKVRAELHYVRAYGMLTLGRFESAAAELDGLDRESGLITTWAERDSVRCLTLIGLGRHSSALALAYEVLDRARSQLDAAAICNGAYLAAFCQFLQGNNREVLTLAETALAVASTSARQSTPLLGLVCMASIVAGRLGDAQLAHVRIDQGERMGGEAHLPTMSTSWPRGQMLLSTGHRQEALRTMREGADALWGRGARWSAVLENLIELELAPDRERLDELSDRLDAVDGEFVGALRAYVEMLIDGDPEGLTAVAPRLAATGRVGIAINAYEHAIRMFEQEQRPDMAATAAREAAEYTAGLIPGTYDSLRFRSADIVLTEREMQLAQLVADGRTNQQIAAELVLSVRTVESHVHRIMRKTATRSRRELHAYLTRVVPPV
ncbi:LuxR family transcriptional regulator [Microbacterium sp. MYb62]|uniref:LuxR family transcriptional regulator n=1 Tax=Microbacterium sp. MYb62 TaxID=1848690 RepID=UPI000CFD9C87|nr:LuxR family transcriptional regulator [Microbacterium sp. MYb62]PRB12897.1 hypothetical protein CQ042_14485 [Microbacterium sp. MYb62]